LIVMVMRYLIYAHVCIKIIAKTKEKLNTFYGADTDVDNDWLINNFNRSFFSRVVGKGWVTRRVGICPGIVI